MVLEIEPRALHILLSKCFTTELHSKALIEVCGLDFHDGYSHCIFFMCLLAIFVFSLENYLAKEQIC